MTRTSLTQLEARDAFIARHIGPSATEQQAMLATLGYPSRAALPKMIAIWLSPAAMRCVSKASASAKSSG